MPSAALNASSFFLVASIGLYIFLPREVRSGAMGRVPLYSARERRAVLFVSWANHIGRSA